MVSEDWRAELVAIPEIEEGEQIPDGYVAETHYVAIADRALNRARLEGRQIVRRTPGALVPDQRIELWMEPRNGTHKEANRQVLLWLYRHGCTVDQALRISQRHLGEQCGLDPRTAGRALREMQEGGLLFRDTYLADQQVPSRIFLNERGLERARALHGSPLPEEGLPGPWTDLGILEPGEGQGEATESKEAAPDTGHVDDVLAALEARVVAEPEPALEEEEAVEEQEPDPPEPPPEYDDLPSRF